MTEKNVVTAIHDTLHDEMVAADLLLQYGQRLGERVASPRCRNIRP